MTDESPASPPKRMPPTSSSDEPTYASWWPKRPYGSSPRGCSLRHTNVCRSSRHTSSISPRAPAAPAMSPPVTTRWLPTRVAACSVRGSGSAPVAFLWRHPSARLKSQTSFR